MTHAPSFPLPVAHVLPAAEAERIWITGDTITIRATAETTGSFTLLDVETLPGGGPPPHLHEHEDEAFLVLAGTFDLEYGGEARRLHPGDFAFVPRGTVHRWATAGEEAGRMLIVFAPGGIEGFFRAAGRPATHDGPAPPLDADEIARTDRVAGDYGLRVAAWSS